jgi:3-methylcrotonyl-CoA carboxylase alpha subunit
VEGFTLWQPLRRQVQLVFAGVPFAAMVEVLPGGGARVTLEDAVHLLARGPDGWRVDGARMKAEMVVAAGVVTVFQGDGFAFDIPDPLRVAAAQGGGADLITAPMPGLVRAVFVAVGERVTAGARLAVLEAMKMEHALVAGRDGVVAEVLVDQGAQVAAGDPIVRLDTEAGRDG